MTLGAACASPPVQLKPARRASKTYSPPCRFTPAGDGTPPDPATSAVSGPFAAVSPLEVQVLPARARLLARECAMPDRNIPLRNGAFRKARSADLVEAQPILVEHEAQHTASRGAQTFHVDAEEDGTAATPRRAANRDRAEAGARRCTAHALTCRGARRIHPAQCPAPRRRGASVRRARCQLGAVRGDAGTARHSTPTGLRLDDLQQAGERAGSGARRVLHARRGPAARRQPHAAAHCARGGDHAQRFDKLSVYSGLQVPELWLWNGERFTLHGLQGDAYVALSRSRFLPDLDLELLARYVNQPDQAAAVRAFIEQVRRG